MSASKSNNGLCKIHNVRFYNLGSRSINYLAYNYKSSKLAVSRLVCVCSRMKIVKSWRDQFFYREDYF